MTLPSRTIEDKKLYTAICKGDSSLNFTIEAFSDVYAKTQLLDKVGYAVFEDPNGNFYIVDADDTDIICSKIEANSLHEAVDVAVTEIGWQLSEPEDLIGGTMGSGFSFEEQ